MQYWGDLGLFRPDDSAHEYGAHDDGPGEAVVSCAACGEPFASGGWHLAEQVWFCAECARRGRQSNQYDLGVVD